jgi:hypothetical protein
MMQSRAKISIPIIADETRTESKNIMIPVYIA